MLPFTVLSPEAATVALVRAARRAVAARLLADARSVPVRLATFAVAAFSAQSSSTCNLGNVSVVVTFLLAVTWRWLDRPLGSVALAAAMSVRPTSGWSLIWCRSGAGWWPLVWAIGARAS